VIGCGGTFWVVLARQRRRRPDESSGGNEDPFPFADEPKAFCRGRIAHDKVPRYVLFVAEFPTTVTGKVQKFKLREMGVERFGLQKAAKTETA
jgi:acyl-CoA synthetase (AMP-forming)/AMP-acid ligase II